MYKSKIGVALFAILLICKAPMIFASEESVAAAKYKLASSSLRLDRRTYVLIGGIGASLNLEADNDQNSEYATQTNTGFEITVGQRFSRNNVFQVGFASLGNYEITTDPQSKTGVETTPRSIEGSFLYFPSFSNSKWLGTYRPNVANYLKFGFAKCYDRGYSLKNIARCDRTYMNVGIGFELLAHPNIALRLEAQSYLPDIHSFRISTVLRGDGARALWALIAAGAYAAVEYHTRRTD